ncbi:MAG: hypothetical protein ACT4OO_04365 [Nitrospiraceae bacterium]
MRNPSRPLDRLAKLIGACLVLSALMPTDALRASTVPPVESILNEAIELVAPSAKAGDEDALVDIAIRQAKVRSCEKAEDLFRTAINLNERWVKEKSDKLRIDAQIGFLERLVAKQRKAGCVEDMKSTSQRLIAIYQQRNQKQLEQSAGDESATALHHFQLQLDLDELHLSMDDFSSARGVVTQIMQHVRAAKWRPGFEFERAAALLARIGRDEDAMEIVDRYDQFYESRQERRNHF